MKKPLRWIPLYVDSWLYGSTRQELTLEQRAVWTDLLALAAKDDGFIRANEDVPYPPDRMAGLLGVPANVLTATIEICIQKQKLERLENGTLYVVKWEDYQDFPQ